jgi:hypothetical protein
MTRNIGPPDGWQEIKPICSTLRGGGGSNLVNQAGIS